MHRSTLLKSAAMGVIAFAIIPSSVYAQDVTLENLGGLGGSTTFVGALSPDGTVAVGQARNGGANQRAYRWVGGMMTDLGTLGGASSSANSLSSDGSIVAGTAVTAGGNSHAFRWENGVMTDLGTLGGVSSFGLALSADGFVVGGQSKIASGSDRAFRWENGVMTDLGTLGGDFTAFYRMSGNGSVIVGSSDIANGDTHAFRWENGVMTDLGTLGGTYSYSMGVSDDGTIVAGGSTTLGGANRVFHWENGIMTDIGTLGGSNSFMGGISADGSIIVGDSHTAMGDSHAFRWENGIITDLGTLGGTSSFAKHISANGLVIVGNAQAGDSSYKTFRWTAEDGMQSLEEILTDAGVDITGWTLNGDSQVNADGSVILGGADYNGKQRAFLMTMNGITTPQEFLQALTPAIGTPTQAMETMNVSTAQSMTASREAFASFASGAFRMSAASLGSSNPSDLNDVATASGPLSRPLYDDSRLAGYVIGSTAFAHEHASGDHNISGTTGMFYRLSDEVAIGAGFTGGHNKRELRLGGESRVASYGGHINIAYEGAEGLRVYGTAGASTLDINMDRNYMNGAGVDTSKGETDGFSYGAALQAGYEMPVTDSISIMPYAAIEASKTKIDGYAETGGAFAATFNDRDTSLVTSRIGAEVSYDTGHDMEIRTRAAWGHVLSENGDDLSATVINLPQTIAYQEGRQDWIEGGVTFSWQYADNTRLVADIGGRSGKDTDTAATATIGLTFGF